MQVIKEDNASPIKLWNDHVLFEDEAIRQLKNIAKLPFVHSHVAAMPDCHWGQGAAIGSVIPTLGAVIPSAVGVDLGCGMRAHKTRFTASDLPDNLSAMRSAIEAAVPHGRTNNGQAGDRGAWGTVPDFIAERWTDVDSLHLNLKARFDKICVRHPQLAKGNLENHLGTLGTGNHFIEVCLDTEQAVWILLHSGSRGVGGRIGSYFINLAKEDMRRWFINLPDANLAYLPEGTDHFAEYVEAVEWAQDFAASNRALMMNAVSGAISTTLGRYNDWLGNEAIQCHHNYISREHHFGKNVIVTRKGAVRARAGELGIIPGSMGAKSFIVRGLGNAQSFHSCSHGAGRSMSRTEAKKRFTLEDHARATQGVECRKDLEVIDETPMAYKDIQAVMDSQTDLVEVVATLKQVLCVKG